MSELMQSRPVFVPDESPVDDDSVLNYVQNTRKFIVADILSDGGLPSDNETRQTLLRTLEGMSSTAVNSKRMKKDTEISADAAKVQSQLMAIFGVIGSKNPAIVDVPLRSGSRIHADEVLADGFLPATGSTDIGIASDDYNTFSERHNLQK